MISNPLHYHLVYISFCYQKKKLSSSWHGRKKKNLHFNSAHLACGYAGNPSGGHFRFRISHSYTKNVHIINLMDDKFQNVVHDRQPHETRLQSDWYNWCVKREIRKNSLGLTKCLSVASFINKYKKIELLRYKNESGQAVSGAKLILSH